MNTESAMSRAGVTGKLSWGAIFGGVLTALGVWLLLYSLGLALGLSSVDAEDPGSLSGLGTGAVTWSFISTVLALFTGGLVASMVAEIPGRLAAAVHGAVVWSITTLAATLLLGVAVTSLVGGALRLGGSAVGVAGSAVSAVNVGDVLSTAGIEADTLLSPINERLRAAGRPEVTPQQLQAASQDLLVTAVREGRLDRQLLTSAIAENTVLSRVEAEELARRMEEQFQAGRGGLARAGDQLVTGALATIDATGKAFWVVFFVQLLGLAAALGGAELPLQRRNGRAQRPSQLVTGGGVSPSVESHVGV